MIASTVVIGDFVRQVGGESVAVRTPVPLATDVHTFRITPGDVVDLTTADLVVVHGGGLEIDFGTVIEATVSGRLLVLVDIVEGLPARLGAFDLHLWLDPVNAQGMVLAIEEALADLDPDGSALYRERANSYGEEIEALDRDIQALLAELPSARRIPVTYHAALGSFAAHYGLELLGFVTEWPEGEPTAQQIARLIDRMKEEEVSRIYTEPQFDRSIVARVAAEARAELRTLFSLPSVAAPTYLEMMWLNA